MTPIPQCGGQPGDVPVTGDFDGDAITDIGVWRPSSATWFIRTSGSGYTAYLKDANNNYPILGVSNDIPVSSDFDGDGRTDIALFRPYGPATSIYLLKSSDSFLAPGCSIALPPGWDTVSGDFDGDCRGDAAAILCDATGLNYWQILTSSSSFKSLLTGSRIQSGGVDLNDPISLGDYDGDGKLYSIRYSEGRRLAHLPEFVGFLLGTPLSISAPRLTRSREVTLLRRARLSSV